MSYWTDDRHLLIEQRRLDANSARAKEKMRRKKVPIGRRAGGWFVMDEVRGWSGPWKTERAAELAREGKYEAAHATEREAGK